MSLPKKIEDLIFTKSNETINPKTYKSVLEKYARSKEICDALSLEETTEIISYITKRDKKKLPTGSDFYGSSAIAKESKTCILLHKGDGICTMVIDKNRDGRWTVTMEYIYDLKNSRFDFKVGFSEKHIKPF